MIYVSLRKKKKKYGHISIQGMYNNNNMINNLRNQPNKKRKIRVESFQEEAQKIMILQTCNSLYNLLQYQLETVIPSVVGEN